ncbi:hypothetical protein ACIGHG_21460 [Bacillus sp. NPDC077411]|uniref:hypothetical protein n=1 Tax=Bacillus sp. NPDC077411 TaxID=3363947 RepID=UPI0037CBE9DD
MIRGTEFEFWGRGMRAANGGKGSFTGVWKEYKFPKTVYNPKKISNSQTIELGKNAMEKELRINA